MSELPEHPATLAPPTVLSPAKRIEAFTGDPNFMTSLARGLAVIHAFQERKRHLTIAQISHRTEIPRAAVRRCLHTLMQPLEEGSECAAVLQQIAAIRGAVNGLMNEVLEGHIREHLGAEQASAEQRREDLELVVTALRSYLK